jgi:predicted HTH domain antitoxin
MQVTLNIPDELAAQIVSGGADLSRAALESLAIEGYRTERLSESEIRRLLGFETRMEVHAFLKEHGAYLHYSLADLERDRESALRMRARRQSPMAASKRRAG